MGQIMITQHIRVPAVGFFTSISQRLLSLWMLLLAAALLLAVDRQSQRAPSQLPQIQLQIFQVKVLQAQILAAGPPVVVCAVLVVTVTAKLHVQDHALHLVLERVLEAALAVAADHVPEVATTHAPVIVIVVVVVVVVTVVDAPEIADLVVMVAVVERVMVVKSLAHPDVEQVEADFAEIVASSVIVNGGLYA